jgi:hypothetical protein
MAKYAAEKQASRSVLLIARISEEVTYPTDMIASITFFALVKFFLSGFIFVGSDSGAKPRSYWGAEALVRCVAALRVFIAIPPQVPDLARVVAVVVESHRGTGSPWERCAA